MKKWILSSVFTASTLLASATVDLHYGGEALVATGTGDFAPYYTSALRHGRLTQSTTLLGEVSAWVPLRLDRRFSWGACVDLVADYGSSVEYARYNPNGWSTHKEHPAPFWIQQAFAGRRAHHYELLQEFRQCQQNSPEINQLTTDRQ